jgi:hypothetical protein
VLATARPIPDADGNPFPFVTTFSEANGNDKGTVNGDTKKNAPCVTMPRAVGVRRSAFGV